MPFINYNNPTIREEYSDKGIAVKLRKLIARNCKLKNGSPQNKSSAVLCEQNISKMKNMFC